jgi:hypothetical protein
MPDKIIRDTVALLKPYVRSLSQIDKDGQSFRFRHHTDGSTNLNELSTINYRLLLNRLTSLQKIVKDLRQQVLRFSEEHRLETDTTKLSRNDLKTIAQKLPKYDNWRSTEFGAAKKQICTEYKLSKTQLSKALNLIKSRRVFSKIIGIEHELVYLSDEKAKCILDLWKEHHGPKNDGMASSKEAKMKVWTANELIQLWRDELPKPPSNILQVIETNFSIEEFAEAQVLFYQARNNEFVELYEEEIQQTINLLRKEDMFSIQINQIMEKTNFEEFFIKGLKNVGKFNLAAELSNNTTSVA